MLKYLGFFFLLFPIGSIASVVSVNPVPDWVNPKAVTFNAQIPKDEVKNGVYDLLVDKQTLVSKNSQQQAFRHYASAILSPEGAETQSQINIDYDPNYETINLHQIIVWRNGLSIDKTKTAKMILLQREKNLEQLIYNGDMTLNILLNDIRVDDIIEYSFSVTGNNPVFGNSFSLVHSINWSVPVESIYLRVLWKKNKKLNYEIKNSSLKMHQRSLPNGIEYWVEDNQIKPFNAEKKMPSWFDPYASIIFSDVENWQEVIQWGKPLFENAIKTTSAIKSTVRQIQQSTKSKTEQIAELLKFVQTEVRYLGIEFGVNSHRPSFAEETLHRHYGDCKDKVVLLIALLREIGVKAYPALVNTETGEDLVNQLPRYTAFNHVITLVEYVGKTYWLDPTRLNQSGLLGDIFQPNYGYALVLKDRNTTLTKVDITQRNSQITVIETYHLYSEPDLSARYHIDTQYNHLESDIIRGQLINRSLSKTRRNYFKFYQDYYPSIREDTPAVFNDDQKTNTVNIEERYIIDVFWERNDEKKRFYGSFFPNLISPFLTLPDDKVRKYPLAVTHPIIRNQTINIYFDNDNWAFEKSAFIENNPFFVYTDSVTFLPKEKKLTLKYSFKSKTNLVKPELFKRYMALLEKLEDRTEYSIYMNISSRENIVSLENETDNNDNYYMAIAIYLVLLSISIIWSWWDVSRNKFNGKVHYYPVSIVKLVVFWAATFGIYAMYWNYKNWKYIQQRDNLRIMPFARGIFYIFWYYPLYQKLALDNEKQEIKGVLPSAAIALLLSIVFLVLIVAGDVFGYEFLSLFLSGLLIIPLANYINSRNSLSPEAIDFNSPYVSD